MYKSYLIKCDDLDERNDNFYYCVMSCAQYGKVMKKEYTIEFQPFGMLSFVTDATEVIFDGVIDADDFDELISDLYEVEDDRDYFLTELFHRLETSQKMQRP